MACEHGHRLFRDIVQCRNHTSRERYADSLAIRRSELQHSNFVPKAKPHAAVADWKKKRSISRQRDFDRLVFFHDVPCSGKQRDYP
jgi:hypothetical protein